MQPRCPDCCSEEAALTDCGRRLECGNCGAGFTREQALVSVADAEAELRPSPPSQELFKLDPERLAAQLSDAEDLIPIINSYSDADELNALADDALCSGIVDCERPDAHFAVYPMSLADAAPILSVNPGRGPTLLGHALKLRQGNDEDLIAFTVRVLAEMVEDANALASTYHADSARLDRITEYMNRPGPWNGGDVCEVVAMELRESGRELLDNADEDDED
jgi:hypothetical protein